MILHELCHALVQGPSNLRSPDWGLDNMSSHDEVREQACLTLQAELTRGYGLRQLLAPTTDFREFYDALPRMPFEIADDVCVALAKDGWGRIDKLPFSPHLREALEATLEIASIASRFSDDDATLWSVFSRANVPA